MSKILKMQLEALKASLNGSIIKSAMLSLIEKNIFKAKHGSLVWVNKKLAKAGKVVWDFI